MNWEAYRGVALILLIVFGILLFVGLECFKAIVGTLLVAVVWAAVATAVAAGRRWPRLSILFWAVMLGGLVAAGLLFFLGGTYHRGWTVYDTDNTGLPLEWVRTIAFDPQGRLWVGTIKGVRVFDSQKWTAHVLTTLYLNPADAGAIAFDPQGRAWVGTRQGVKVFDGQSWATYNTHNSGLVDNYVRTIASDAQGRAWAGTKVGISVFDGQSWATYNTRNSDLPQSHVRAITLDPQGRAWVGTVSREPPSWFKGTSGTVAVFDSRSWTIYNDTNSGLPSGLITSIAFDAQGRAWVGTQTGIGMFSEEEEK